VKKKKEAEYKMVTTSQIFSKSFSGLGKKQRNRLAQRLVNHNTIPKRELLDQRPKGEPTDRSPKNKRRKANLRKNLNTV
jgi:hypothetical protein